MITYLLAIASPTHGVPASLYAPVTRRRARDDHRYGKRETYYGIQLDMNYSPGSPGPLFFTDYSYMGYDPQRPERCLRPITFRTTATKRS